MKSLKDEVGLVFSQIQYQIELYIFKLDELKQLSQSLALKKAFKQLMIEKLNQNKQSLLNSATIDDIQSNLAVITTDYDGLFRTIQQQIDKLKNGEDISDYIYQLNELSNDVFFKLKNRVKQLF